MNISPFISVYTFSRISFQSRVQEMGTIDDVRDFFDRWALYRKIVDGNYLFHHEVYARLREFVDLNFKTPLFLPGPGLRRCLLCP
ncbi:MAG: hypothetical protein HPY61_00860 [Methanotrichaceae archaeon]|nr:hypothetical protein [Methanotrichaceae archaeon]